MPELWQVQKVQDARPGARLEIMRLTLADGMVQSLGIM